MTTDLTEAVQRCDICQLTRPAITKEPLMNYPIPNPPWQIVARDCFECDGSHYLIVVDLYSDYIEIKQLNSLSSAALIEQVKHIFAVHGIPITLISDNGPNYASVEFTDFSHDWDIQHVTSSPHHPKANGKAESAVKIMKSIISKANQQGTDVWKLSQNGETHPLPLKAVPQSNALCHPEQDHFYRARNFCTSLKSSLL